MMNTVIRGDMNDELREQLADVQHAIWAHWMRYMFTCGQFAPDGTWHMPAFKAERWQRQMDTPYSELTDRERESDRDQADKILLLIRSYLEAAILTEVYGKRLAAAEAWLTRMSVDANNYGNYRASGTGTMTFEQWQDSQVRYTRV